MLGVASAAFIASSPGQTVVVSQFNTSFREDLGLSPSALSGAYMVGTVLASLPLVLVGSLSDRFGPRLVTGVIAVLFALACASVGLARGLVSLTVRVLPASLPRAGLARAAERAHARAVVRAPARDRQRPQTHGGAGRVRGASVGRARADHPIRLAGRVRGARRGRRADAAPARRLCSTRPPGLARAADRRRPDQRPAGARARKRLPRVRPGPARARRPVVHAQASPPGALVLDPHPHRITQRARRHRAHLPRAADPRIARP